MKIALILPGGVDRSGEYRVIPTFLALIERLAHTHDVHVFALHQEPQPSRWPLVGATVHNIGEYSTRWRAIKAIRTEHTRAPFDVIQAIFSGSCSFIAVTAALLLRVPSLVHIAGGELVALHAIGYGGRRSWKGRLREAVTLRCAHVVTAASAPIIDALSDLGIVAQRIPLGVDTQTWLPQLPRPRRPGVRRLIHVASLNRVKDQSTLLRALAIVAKKGVDFEMDIVGVDTLDGEVQRLARDVGLAERLHFLGFKTQRELRPLMERAELLVMSSLHEAGPLVLLEAAVAGVPTVGTAVGHLAEWAPNAALAVPTGDHHALAQALCTVLDDENLRLRLANEAQRRALQEDADYTARAFESLYRLLSAHRTRRYKSALARQNR